MKLLCLYELITMWIKADCLAQWKVRIDESDESDEDSFATVPFQKGGKVLVLSEGRWQEAEMLSHDDDQVQLRFNNGSAKSLMHKMLIKYDDRSVDRIATIKDYKVRQRKPAFQMIKAEKMRQLLTAKQSMIR